jgi:two-component system response regulator MprA
VSAVRVLVVEDDPNVRGLLRTLLEAEGYAVDTASDGLGALGQAAASSPALVLLDLVMPDLGGCGCWSCCATTRSSSGSPSSW